MFLKHLLTFFLISTLNIYIIDKIYVFISYYLMAKNEQLYFY